MKKVFTVLSILVTLTVSTGPSMALDCAGNACGDITVAGPNFTFTNTGSRTIQVEINVGMGPNASKVTLNIRPGKSVMAMTFGNIPVRGIAGAYHANYK